MQKRSHKLLATTLMSKSNQTPNRPCRLALLFGSFEPDCNPLTYLRGTFSCKAFGGHNYTNSANYINRKIKRLQKLDKWRIWHYYIFGKLTHYLSDAFTYPHNENYPDSILEHRHYEDRLREYLSEFLSNVEHREFPPCDDITEAIEKLHNQYMNTVADMTRDATYILEANRLLMGVFPVKPVPVQ